MTTTTSTEVYAVPEFVKRGTNGLFTVGTCEVYACGYDKLDKFIGDKFDVVLALNGKKPPEPTRVSFFGSVVKLLSKTKKVVDDVKGLTNVVEVDWADFGVPKLPLKFWTTLHEEVRSIKDGKLLVYCQGGTGRTGTALAILLGLEAISSITDTSTQWDVDSVMQFDPVKAVRVLYKHDAVETNSQLGYVEYVTGLKTKATCSKAVGTSYWDSKKDDKKTSTSTQAGFTMPQPYGFNDAMVPEKAKQNEESWNFGKQKKTTSAHDKMDENVTCPHCKKLAPAFHSFCRNCGHMLPEVE